MVAYAAEEARGCPEETTFRHLEVMAMPLKPPLAP